MSSNAIKIKPRKKNTPTFFFAIKVLQGFLLQQFKDFAGNHIAANLIYFAFRKLLHMMIDTMQKGQ